MRRVAEIMHIAPEKRDAFLRETLHPTEEMKKVLWKCGVRNQQYFGANSLIFMTFEYAGIDFREDMSALSAYLDSIGLLIAARRRDVPVADRSSVSWWAPVKKLGQLMDEPPAFSEEELNPPPAAHSLVDIYYDEQDWVDDFHF